MSTSPAPQETQHQKLDPRTEALNAQLQAFEQGALAAGADMVAGVVEIDKGDGISGYLWRVHADSGTLLPALGILIERLTPEDFVRLFEAMAREEHFKMHRAMMAPGEFVRLIEGILRDLRRAAKTAPKDWKN